MMWRAARTIGGIRRRAASPGGLMYASILATLGMVSVCVVMLVELRRDAWDRADQAASNVLQAVAGDIARNVELYDLSLQAVVENLGIPAVMGAPPDLRRRILFDRAATAKGLGTILVADATGQIVDQSREMILKSPNLADRDYFRVQREADAGLYVSEPFVSRLSGEWVIALSRRVTDSEGRFAGIVIGTIALSYVEELFAKIDIGRNGAVALLRDDGTILLRRPSTSHEAGRTIAGSVLFQHMRRSNEGRVIGPSAIDGVDRAVSFRRVGSQHLVLALATGVEDIVGPWRAKALTIGLGLVLLSGTAVGLALLFRREIERRTRAEAAMAAANAELAALSVTDALTGLANRRRFDTALERECRRTRRVGCPLSLLVLDADHFKACNDRYGHAVGDRVLKGLARAVAGALPTAGSIAARVGGEEFAVILPDADREAALLAAAAIHRAVANLSEPGGEGTPPITVSIGAVCVPPHEEAKPEGIFAAADAALYAAKRQGRNRTTSAWDLDAGVASLVA